METYSTMCRLCLATPENRFNLFEAANSTKYLKQLGEIFQIELQELPGWPLTACSPCIQKLNDMVEFKATILSAQEKLSQMLPDIQTKTEPVEIEDPIAETSFPLTDDNRIEPAIVSQVWIKEERFPENEENEETPLGKKRVPTREKDNYASGVDSGEEPPKKRYNGNPVQKSPTVPDKSSLKVFECQKCEQQFISFNSWFSHKQRVHTNTITAKV